MKNSDPILTDFRHDLEKIYGDNLTRVVLFGSRARGDAQKDSDYDVAVFLKSLPDRWQELDRLSELSLDIVDRTGAVVNALPYAATAYMERTSLMKEIRQEGVEV